MGSRRRLGCLAATVLLTSGLALGSAEPASAGGACWAAQYVGPYNYGPGAQFSTAISIPPGVNVISTMYQQTPANATSFYVTLTSWFVSFSAENFTLTNIAGSSQVSGGYLIVTWGC